MTPSTRSQFFFNFGEQQNNQHAKFALHLISGLRVKLRSIFTTFIRTKCVGQTGRVKPGGSLLLSFVFFFWTYKSQQQLWVWLLGFLDIDFHQLMIY